MRDHPMPARPHARWLAALPLLFILGALAGCSDQRGESFMVRVDGSSTVFPITEAVAEEFQRTQRVRTAVGISGTGGGFKKFCRGEVDLAEASRPILQEEIEACRAAGIDFIELPIAYDALTVVVHPDNDFIDSLSVDELRTMWAPEAQNIVNRWNQVNPAWPDRPLRLYGAGSDSGTFDYFTEAIMGKAKASRGDYTASEDDNVIVRGVSGDIGALGYFGFAYFVENQPDIKAVPIVASQGATAVLPSAENVMNGSYQPLSRPLFIYVNARSANTEIVRDFIDFYLQNSEPLIREVGFIPLPAEDQLAVIAHWQARATGTGFGGEPQVGVKVQDLLRRP